jgi:hypothetical protein
VGARSVLGWSPFVSPSLVAGRWERCQAEALEDLGSAGSHFGVDDDHN